MALIKCPECGKEISDKASICPNCGCPINTENAGPKLVHSKQNYVKIKIPFFNDKSRSFSSRANMVNIKNKNGTVIWRGPSNSTASFELQEETDAVFTVEKHLQNWPKGKVIACVLLALTGIGIFIVCGIGIATSANKNTYIDFKFLRTKITPGKNYEIRVISSGMRAKHFSCTLSEVDNIDSDI